MLLLLLIVTTAGQAAVSGRSWRMDEEDELDLHASGSHRNRVYDSVRWFLSSPLGSVSAGLILLSRSIGQSMKNNRLYRPVVYKLEDKCLTNIAETNCMKEKKTENERKNARCDTNIGAYGFV